jgi:hypothetical protein
VGCFGAIYVLDSWQFFDYNIVLPLSQPEFAINYHDGVPLRPTTEQPIINYERDNLWDILHLTLPMYLVMALGLHFRELLQSWQNWIGKARTPKERGAWLSISLGYVMVVTALVSLLALFASGQNRLWELGWSAWAFFTFVFALAAFRWAKWGARGLLISGMILLPMAFAYDALIMYYKALEGVWPKFLETIILQIPFTEQSIQAPQLFFWAMWSIILGILAWGALRRALWAGIGLVVMLIAWFVVAIFSPLMGSIYVFAITNLALIAYALSAKYGQMELERWPLASRPAVAAAGSEPLKP